MQEFQVSWLRLLVQHDLQDHLICDLHPRISQSSQIFQRILGAGGNNVILAADMAAVEGKHGRLHGRHNAGDDF